MLLSAAHAAICTAHGVLATPNPSALVSGCDENTARHSRPSPLLSRVNEEDLCQRSAGDYPKARPTIVTEWPSIFPNAATTTALIDRVVHHAEIITIEGESYRRRVAEAQQKSARAIASH